MSGAVLKPKQVLSIQVALRQSLESGALGRPVRVMPFSTQHSWPVPAPPVYISVTWDLFRFPGHIILAFSVIPPCLFTRSSLSQRLLSSSFLFVKRLTPPACKGTVRLCLIHHTNLTPCLLSCRHREQIFLMEFVSCTPTMVSVSGSIISLQDKETKTQILCISCAPVPGAC